MQVVRLIQDIAQVTDAHVLDVEAQVRAPPQQDTGCEAEAGYRL